MKKIAIVLIALFSLFALAALLLQTSFVQTRVQKWLISSLERSGVSAQIGEIEGALPTQLIIKNGRFEAFGYIVFIEQLETHFSWIRLLKKEIAFTELKAQGIQWKPSEETTRYKTSGAKKEGLSFRFAIDHFSLKDVQLLPSILGNIEGSLDIGSYYSSGSLEALIQRSDLPEANGQLSASYHKRRGVEGTLKLEAPSLKALQINSAFDGPLTSECTFKTARIATLLNRQSPLHFHIKGQFTPREIPLHFTASAKRNIDGTWSITQSKIVSDFATLKGRGFFDSQGRFQSAELQLQSNLKQASLDTFHGRLFGYAKLESEKEGLLAKASFRIPKLEAHSMQVEALEGALQARLTQETWVGSATLRGNAFSQAWIAASDFSWSFANSLKLQSAQIEGPALQIKADLELKPNWIVLGSATFNSPQIHPIAPELYGQIAGKALLSEEAVSKAQTLQLDITASDAHWNLLSCRTFSLYSDLIDPFTHPKGSLFLSFEEGRWKQLLIESASIETSSQTGKSGLFSLDIDGSWKHPLSLHLNGEWNYQSPTVSVALQNGLGSFFNHPLHMAAPSKITWAPEILHIDPIQWQLSDASLSGSLRREGAATDATIAINHLPLDFLSLNPLDVAIQGRFNLDASLQERGETLTGQCKMTVQDMEVKQLGEPDPFLAAGVFNTTFTRDRIEVNGDLTVRDAPLLTLNASLPIHLHLFPFEVFIQPHKKAQGSFQLKGRVEDVLDFFDLGKHRLEGDCNCNLRFFNSLSHPLLEGYCDLENGYYQNYTTGMELNNLRAEWFGDGNALYLRKLLAEDAQKKGSFTASGKIEALYQEDFPFKFNISFSRLNCVEIDLVTAEATGTLAIQGNAKEALAKGSVQILETDFLIPDRIPRNYPDLDVVYRNASKPPAIPSQKEKTPYPLHLDIHVDAPEGVFIAGRGLNSEWKGNFHLTGTQTAPAMKGKIELLRGDFLFSGRRFRLTDGALSMTGIENEMPYLNLAGSMDVKGVSIIARLKGPLNNPQLTLQSVPPLPMGSIMAYLLFGQDLSEINSFQALQLANSISSLAGEGPGVLEKTRRSLGVDRLEVISVPTNDEDEGDTIALQVGKYIAEGVIVSFSQGAEDKSGNISIEVELRNGFSLTLESQQLQEQGVFGIKWHLNY